MKIGVIGLGYVGLTTALGLADLGHTVLGYELDLGKRAKIEEGTMPLYEEGLQEILDKTLKKNFFTVNSLEEVLFDTVGVYICVPTPSNEDGSIDLRFILDVAHSIGKIFRNMHNNPLIIVKSTIVPGTTMQVKEILTIESGKEFNNIHVAMMPEFLKQGSAIKDFKHPDRLVFGIESGKSQFEALFREMYSKIESKKVFIDLETAEFSKYASNSFLALKISFANELANIVDAFNLRKVGRNVDIEKIVEIMGMDRRINPSYLGAGPGFGGSCFPKDVKALNAFSIEHLVPSKLLQSITKVNEDQAHIVIKHTKNLIGPLKNKKIGILGLAFTYNTDDTREAPSKRIIKILLQEQAIVHAWDPKAEPKMREEFPDIIYHKNIQEFENEGLDIVLIVTEWKEIRDYLKSKENLPYKIIDTRRIGIEAEIVIGHSRLK